MFFTLSVCIIPHCEPGFEECNYADSSFRCLQCNLNYFPVEQECIGNYVLLLPKSTEIYCSPSLVYAIYHAVFNYIKHFYSEFLAPLVWALYISIITSTVHLGVTGIAYSSCL